MRAINVKMTSKDQFKSILRNISLHKIIKVHQLDSQDLVYIANVAFAIAMFHSKILNIVFSNIFMEQINFRVQEDEKQVLKALAEMKGISVPELVKQAVLKEIGPLRIDLAFQLLKGGKIGRKRTWILSGLSYHEFLVEWSKRGAEEVIPEEAAVKELELVKTLDLKKYLQKSPSQ